jgi:hypothetical protein
MSGRLAECLEIPVALCPREFVDLGRDDVPIDADSIEPSRRIDIGRQRRMARVDQVECRVIRVLPAALRVSLLAIRVTVVRTANCEPRTATVIRGGHR